MDEQDHNALESPWQRTRIRVPRGDEAILAIPPLNEAAHLVEENATVFSQSRVEISGRSLTSLREDSKHQALNAAVQFTCRLTGEQACFESPDRIVASGHQPELFHPGVWIKNFAVSTIAQAQGANSLNLIVDSDTLNSRRIRIPAGTRKSPRIDSLEFDASRAALPYEEARIEDPRLYSTFADRAADALCEFRGERDPIQPIIKSAWPESIEAGNPLTEALSQPRMRLERQLGFGNLELPMSQLCQLEPFCWFAADVILRAADFRKIHNRTLAEYRHVNRIRSRTHPVPELAEHGGWIETPFLVWKAGDSQRKPVFVRNTDSQLQLSSAPDDSAILIETGGNQDCQCLAEEILRLSNQNIRFRTRALTTTLFVRLCLADLFVHGIGGAKYDEMTDRIISRFYGVQPPEFLTLSATAFLPIAEPFGESLEDAAKLKRLMRDFQHNSQRHLSSDERAAALIAEKAALISEQEQSIALESSSPRGLARYRRFPQINRELAKLTEPQQNAVRDQLSEIERRLAANAILKSREFSFCLYPRPRIEKMLAGLRAEFLK